MARPKKKTVKGPGSPVRLDDDEKRYLTEAADRDADGAGLPLSTFLRSAGYVRARELLGMTFEEWKIKDAKAKRKASP